jgi:hypothetical protein
MRCLRLLVLDTVTRGRREMKLLAYLSLPAFGHVGSHRGLEPQKEMG